MQKKKIKIIKIPSSQGGLGKADGSELAPDRIIEQTKDLFVSEDETIPKLEIDEVKIIESNIEETNKNIYKKAKQVLKEKPVFLGGDHSITYPLVKAFSETFENPGIIIFDAHPDAENDFNPPTQEDLLPVIVNQNIIKKENIILVGTRNWHQNEIEFLKNNNIRYFHMKEIAEKGISAIAESIISIAKNFNALYISIDIDVLDPAFAPGTGYNEPGGLTSRQLLTLLKKLKTLNNIKAYDIMEICPKKDINNITSKMGAKLIIELI
ncbi:MAG: arginase family protein [Nanoarchaeota archaeon]|nr:arginase family protein [Nanoarchaeota archaeon]